MKSRKMLVYLFPFIVCAIFTFNNGFTTPDILFRGETINVFQWVKEALELAFNDTGSAMTTYIAWLVTYSILFEFGMVLVKVVTFLPHLMDKMFDKFVGEKND